ncbi:MAG: hypothetical protein K0Q76_1569 [Panacagrimonas sp.]|jgi:hypothetical protein|nr:hypothetical protein [Panacagrimonas sp.]MCC2656461.1 hypothetical protein [Panacagrimonas sp.]
MASTHLSAAELLALEDRQIGFFLADARPLEANAADLYPVAQVLHTACIALAAQLPKVIDEVVARVGSPEAFAHRLRRVLSHATARDLAGAALIATWGREMARLEALDDIAPNDADCAAVLRFCYEVIRHYRIDGEPHPDDAAGLGSNYRILPAAEAQALAQRCDALGPTQAGEVRELTRAMRALAFLAEGQLREAVMMHGPYPTGTRGMQLIVVECADVQGTRTPGEDFTGIAPVEVASLAIAIQVRDCDITADRFGTLHLQTWDTARLVAASLLTRTDQGLCGIPIARAGDLRRQFEARQAALRQRVADWQVARRMSAGIGQAHALLCRLLTAAGCSHEELEIARQRAREAGAPIVARHFDRNLQRAPEELPFFIKLRAYLAGDEPRLFTPFGSTTG